jgi:hypothetical protein
VKRLGEIEHFKDHNLRLNGADIATQRGWTGVPNFILESKELSVGAKLTYAMSVSLAKNASQKTLGTLNAVFDLGSKNLRE